MPSFLTIIIGKKIIKFVLFATIIFKNNNNQGDQFLDHSIEW